MTKKPEAKAPDFSHIYDMAKKLGMNKVNLDIGLGSNPDTVSKAVIDAYNFKFPKVK